VGLSFHLRLATDALCTTPMQMNLLKIWFNDFLQNAAFPAVVLAFACAPINNEIRGVRTGNFTDHIEVANPRADSPYRSHEPESIVPADESLSSKQDRAT
jgi:hypothetical protein